MSFISPVPCSSGGAGGPEFDVEQNLLCDIGPEGEILGTALAVYEYDGTTGSPVGPPTFVDPSTGLPYVAQGVLQPCPGEIGCLPPLQFCFSSSTTTPTPGRQYDLTLNIAQGFNVEDLVIDLTSYPLNIVWGVNDADGSQFASDLQAALQAKFPGQTVTVTPPAGAPFCGDPQPFQIHIECFVPISEAPTLVQLHYNGGQDLIQNPAFLQTPPGTGQLAFIKRQDAGGDMNCTNIANRGWETNDDNASFEMWGKSSPPSAQNLFAATTLTPRNTPVQEINAFGSSGGTQPDTIWQTFNVAAPGNFTIKVTIGGRRGTESVPVKLSTGDVNDTGIGDIINTVVVAGQVTNENFGTPGPWTVFTQTVPLAAGTYTLAFTGPITPPSTPGSGGLFTDMRVYQDAPHQLATFVDDDNTCTAPVSSTSVVCQYWQPQCAEGNIVGWKKVSDGTELSNSAFWAQVPAPVCCPGVVDAGSGGGTTSAGNLVQTYPVCGIVGGIPTTLERVVVTDQSGGAISDTFIGPDGAPVTPSSFQVGSCTDQAFVNDEVLCDDNGPFLRKYIQTINQGIGQITGHRDFTLAGLGYVTVGTVRACGPQDTGSVSEFILCDQLGVGNASILFIRKFIQDADGAVTNTVDLTFDGDPYVVQGTVGTCNRDVEQNILCDDTGPFLRIFAYDPDGGIALVYALNFDGTSHPIVGTIRPCPIEVSVEPPEFEFEEEVLCDLNGPFIRRFTFNTTTQVTTVTDLDLSGAPYVVSGAVGSCPVPCCPEEICYRQPLPGPFVCTGLALTAEPNSPITSVAVTANPNAWPVSLANLALTFNGSVAGTPVMIDNKASGVLNTGVTIEYYLAVPNNNVRGLNLWNQWGGNWDDADGMGPGTILTVLDSLNNVLFTGPLNAGNHGAPFYTDFGGIFDDVATVRISNITDQVPHNTPPVHLGTGWREVRLLQSYEAFITATCAGQPLSIDVTGPNAGLTLVGNQLTQTNGPHTMVFTIPAGFKGHITTNTPAAFSSLEFVNGTVITLSGNATVSFDVHLDPPDGVGPPIPGTVTYDPVTGLPIIRDANTGLIVSPATIVPCFSVDDLVGKIRDTEYQILCDDTTSFLRRFTTTGNDTPLITDTALDGTTTYVPQGTVKICSNEEPGGTVFHGDFIVCDSNGTQFLRKFIQNNEGFVQSVIDLDLAGLAFTPVGTVGKCPVVVSVEPAEFEFEEEILCDNNGPFIRRFTFNTTTQATVVTNLTLAGVAYVPVGTVSVCPVVVSVEPAEFEFEEEILCDNNGPFIRRFTFNTTTQATVVTNLTLAGAAYVPVGTVGVCPVVVSVEPAEFEFEEEVLCDNNGPFIRRFTFNTATQATVTTDLTLAGAAYVVVGPIKTCSPTSSVNEFILCSIQQVSPTLTTKVPFIRKFFQDANGVVTNTVNLTLAGLPFTPAASGIVTLCEENGDTEVLCDDNGPFLRRYSAGDSDDFLLDGITNYVTTGVVQNCAECCPINIGEGCTNVGSFTYVTIRNSDGSIQVIDPITGLPVPPANIVPCTAPNPINNAIDSTIQRLTAAGSIVIPAGARSITVTVMAGSPTVQIAADPVITLQAGLSLTWAVDDRNETLLNAHTFTGVAGADFYVTTTRL